MSNDENLPPEIDEVDRARVREMVIRLIDQAKMTPQDISAAMDGRVSPRTIYRWAKGESEPQNTSALRCLQELVDQRC